MVGLDMRIPFAFEGTGDCARSLRLRDRDRPRGCTGPIPGIGERPRRLAAVETGVCTGVFTGATHQQQLQAADITPTQPSCGGIRLHDKESSHEPARASRGRPAIPGAICGALMV
jgi:hypothetical protein